MKQLKKYFKVVKEIYDYFDYSNDKKIYPIEDYTDFYWKKKNNKLYYSYDKIEFYDDIFLKEYEGDDYIMFLINDTHNLDDCLIIFDLKKKLNDDINE